MKFRPINISDHKHIQAALTDSFTNHVSEYDFVTGFIWNPNTYHMAEYQDVLYLYGEYNNAPVFAPPVAPLGSDITPHIKRIKEYTKNIDKKFIVRGIDDATLKRIDAEYLNTLAVTYEREAAEYVYNTVDLIELTATKSLRDKRNRLIKFESNYDYIFREYKKTDFDAVMNLYNIWTKNTDHGASSERTAIQLLLNNYDELNIKGGIIEIDGNIAAYAFASIMYSGCPQVLIEKADISYYGIYQAINKYFTEGFLKEYPLVNRQEDLGIEGVRRAKMSYSPAFIIEKYRLGDKKI